MVVDKVFTKVKREYAYMRTAERQARLLRFRRGYVPWLPFALSLPLLLPLAVLLRICLLILKPFVHVRFGQIGSFQMGQHAITMELYLCELDAGWHPRRSLDIFYHRLYEHFNRALVRPLKAKNSVANKQLDTMFNRSLHTLEFARRLDGLNRLLPRSEEFVVPGSEVYDRYGLLDSYPQHLNFTESEEETGRSGLRAMGIEPDSPFVCFHARDGVWIRQEYPRISSVYGEWTLGEPKNSSVGNYLLAAEQLTGLGYYAIRMGKYVAEPIVPPNSHVIDYSTKFHSDFMDIFVFARCAFFIGCNSGITTLPLIFRKPIAFVNIFALAEIKNCTNKPNIFIPKMLYSTQMGRLLSFRETMDFGFAQAYPDQEENRKLYERMGVVAVENSPQEIADLSLEMHQRLNGEFVLTPEDQELQARFLSLVRSYNESIRIERGLLNNLRIGKDFARTHQEWLA